MIILSYNDFDSLDYTLCSHIRYSSRYQILDNAFIDIHIRKMAALCTLFYLLISLKISFCIGCYEIIFFLSEIIVFFSRS